MIDIASLKKQPWKFTSLFFVSPENFNLLAVKVERLWKATEKQRKSSTNKKHRVLTTGSGRLFKCTIEERLAMFLLYEKTQVSHAFLGKLFGVDESRISQYFKRLRPIVKSSFDYSNEKLNISEEDILYILENY